MLNGRDRQRTSDPIAALARPSRSFLFGECAMKITRRFTRQGQDALNSVEYEKRTSRITNPDGGLFIYHVIETKIVGPKDVSVMDQQNYERKLLTLQTSWPVGTALKRYIAVCEIDEQATYGTSSDSNTDTSE